VRARELGTSDRLRDPSTANRLPGSGMTWPAPLTSQVKVLSNNFIDPLFDSVVEICMSSLSSPAQAVTAALIFTAAAMLLASRP
jgi:hypothetical protein